MGFSGTKPWRIPFCKSVLSTGGRWLGWHWGQGCLVDKVTAAVTGKWPQRRHLPRPCHPPAPLLEEGAPEIKMCREGIRWGDHVWQRLSSYLFYHLCGRLWEVNLLFSKEISNSFLPWGGIFFHCIFKQFDVISHRQCNFNAHHTVYQLSVKLSP